MRKQYDEPHAYNASQEKPELLLVEFIDAITSKPTNVNSVSVYSDVYLDASMISCHVVSTVTYCIYSSEQKLTNFAACNFHRTSLFLFCTSLSCWSLDNRTDLFVIKALSFFFVQRFSSQYYYVWNHFLFSFMSPSLSHERTLSLPLLKFLSSNVWMIHRVTVWLWHPLYNQDICSLSWGFSQYTASCSQVLFPFWFSFLVCPLFSLISLVCKKKKTYCTLSLGELMLQDTQSC